jgi:Nickel responsive protein SCO4226-like
MVYVVERYLPGLSRSDLLHGLSRLETATRAPQCTGDGVRYLGSTIVLGDEACFCQFEGPSEAAVAEANERAGLSFDRIVPAVTVRPTKGEIG